MQENEDILKQQALRSILSNATILWESIGPDGITYNFNTNTLRMKPEDARKARLKMAVVDDSVAYALARCIPRGEAGDATLGRILRKQVEKYQEKNINDYIKNLEA